MLYLVQPLEQLYELGVTIFYPHFTDEGIEGERTSVICSRSYSLVRGETKLQIHPWLAYSNMQVINCYTILPQADVDDLRNIAFI